MYCKSVLSTTIVTTSMLDGQQCAQDASSAASQSKQDKTTADTSKKMRDEKARTLTDATATGYSACLGKADAIKRDSGCTTQIYL